MAEYEVDYLDMLERRMPDWRSDSIGEEVDLILFAFKQFKNRLPDEDQRYAATLTLAWAMLESGKE